METFDFEHEEFKKHSSGIRGYLQTIYRAKISEDSFVEGYNLNTSRHQAPSKLRGVYRSLKRKYNFFA